MARFRYDRSSKWLIEHHGNLILYLGNVRNIVDWRAAPAEVVQPRKLPDGLLEVRRQDETDFHPYIVEIETYADDRVVKDLLEEMMLVYLDRAELPDVLTVVLRPRGQQQVDSSIEIKSRGGFSSLGASWHVVPLWTIPAQELLATGEPGLMPWVSLTNLGGEPEPVLRQCRTIIDQATPAQQRNLLAVTQVFLGLAYKDKSLFDLFGGNQAMIDSPVLNDLIAKQRAEAATQAVQGAILAVLKKRFPPVPEEVTQRLQGIVDQNRLEQLNVLAASCATIREFTQELS